MAPTRHAVLAAASILLAQVVADCNISSNYTIIDAPDDSKTVSTCDAIDGSLSLLFNSAPSSWPSEASVDLGSVGSIEGDLVIYPSSEPKKTIATAKSLKKVDGDITISVTGTTSSVQEVQISFPALEQVQKNYVISGPYQTFTVEHAKSLTIGGLMRVSDLESTDLSLGGVSSVKEDFSINSNKNLQTLTVGDLTTAEKAFALTAHSKLTKATFASLKTIKGDGTIYQNSALTSFALPALETAGTFSFTSNGANAALYLPKLQSLGSGNSSSTSTFESVSSIQLASLTTVKGALAFQSTSIEDLTVPLLKNVNGSITVQSNPSLTTLAIPRVSTVTDIFIKKNDKLTNFTANALKTVHSISISGSLTNVEFFGLKEVTGDFEVSGASSMDCYWFQQNLKKIVKGKFNCVGNYDEKERKSSTGGIENTEGNPSDYMTDIPDDTTGTNSNGGSSNGGGGSNSDDKDEAGSGGGLSTGAKAGIGAGVAVAVLLVLALLFCLWRKKREQPSSLKLSDSPPPSLPVLPMMEKHTVISSNSSSSEDVNSQYSSHYSVNNPNGVTMASGAINNNNSGNNSSNGGNNNSRSSIYEGDQKLGVYTTIEAGEPSSPSQVGTLNFGRISLLSSASKRLSDKGMGAWKTIRRVSVSSGEDEGNASSNSGKSNKSGNASS
ncbi:unnamed protein product [Clonostachys rosea]|uniref:Receptor L-domain domain-containing protein n=1 Tax=Bionectria ochroleuca TaxID=29856 RepID=A0ABY6TQU3_BIOOC|nr:unnamed protein product [Clonostachys rosea]